MKVDYLSKEIEVRVAGVDGIGDESEIYLRIGGDAYLFPLDGAARLAKALMKNVDEARALSR